LRFATKKGRLLNLRVLSTYKTYLPDPPGGVQEVIRQICLSTTALGVKNTIFTLSPFDQPKVIEMAEANIVREKSIISPASCDIGGIKSFKKYAQLITDSDLLHFHYPWPFADLLHLTNKSNKPSVITYHSDIVRQKMLNFAYSPLMWKMLQSMDVIVATSPAYVETSMILQDKTIRDKVKVIPLGIDESTYPAIVDDDIFAKFNLKNEPYFLFLGALRYYKGLHTLVKSAKLINTKIVIAGSGPQEASLKKQILELGCNNIIFTGQVTQAEKVGLLKSCYAFILPSHLRSEAYGMVLVEASMMGKPMITCEIGTGTSFVNLHEKTGLVVMPENSDALAHAMNTLFMDGRLAKEMGLNARKRYKQLFSGTALGKAYIDIYKDLK
jgi:glycosyltransferase involved in cell wall biosynthesis